MARSLKDKLPMPKKKADEMAMEEELSMDLGDEPSESSDEELPMAEDEMPPEENMSGELEMFSDEELFEEAKKRGLLPEDAEMASPEEESSEEPSEEMSEEEDLSEEEEY